jgi:penicillin amidase
MVLMIFRERCYTIEFKLIGVENKIHHRRCYNIYGYMSFSFAMAQKSDPLMTDIHVNME